MSTNQPNPKRNPIGRSFLHGLPKPLWLKIMLYMDINSLARFLAVSKAFNQLSEQAFYLRSSHYGMGMQADTDYHLLHRQELDALTGTVLHLLHGKQRNTQINAPDHNGFLEICRRGNRAVVREILQLQGASYSYVSRNARDALLADPHMDAIVDVLIAAEHYSILSDIVANRSFPDRLLRGNENEYPLVNRLMALYETASSAALENVMIVALEKVFPMWEVPQSLIDSAVAFGAKRVVSLLLQEKINHTLGALDDAEVDLTPLHTLLKQLPKQKYHFLFCSPIHHAACTGNLKLFTFLFNHPYFDPLSFDSEGFTPLHSVISYSENFRPDESSTEQDKKDDTELAQITRQRIQHILQMYIERYGEAVLQKLTLDNLTLLDVAIDATQESAIRVLLTYPQINPNSDVSGVIPLFRLCQGNYLPQQLAELFFNNPRVDLTQREQGTQETCLMRVIEARCETNLMYEGLNPLLQANKSRAAGQQFDINATNQNGNTALHLVFQRNYVPHDIVIPSYVITTLLAEGLQPGVRNQDGKTAANLAINRGQLELLKLIVNHDDFDMKDLGSSLLFTAIYRDKRDCFNWLLAHPDIDLSVCTERSIPQVISNALYTSEDVLAIWQALIERNRQLPPTRQYDINFKDVWGDTILHYFLRMSGMMIFRQSLIETLVYHPRLDVNAKNLKGESVVQVGLRTNYRSCARFLNELVRHPDLNIDEVVEIILGFASPAQHADIFSSVLQHPRLTSENRLALMQHLFGDAIKQPKNKEVLSLIEKIVALERVKQDPLWRTAPVVRQFMSRLAIDYVEDIHSQQFQRLVRAGLPCEAWLAEEEPCAESLQPLREQLRTLYQQLTVINHRHDGRMLWNLYINSGSDSTLRSCFYAIQNGALSENPIAEPCLAVIRQFHQLGNHIRAQLCRLLANFCDQKLVSSDNCQRASSLILDLLSATELDEMQQAVDAAMACFDPSEGYSAAASDAPHKQPMTNKMKGIGFLAKVVKSYWQTLQDCMQAIQQHREELDSQEEKKVAAATPRGGS